MKPYETPKARALRVWDAAAPRYDRDIAFFERIQFGGGREWVCSRATGRVLEVAIGTGRNLPYYPPDAILTGVELSPAMLAIAKQRAAELGRKIDLYEADAQDLPFEDASFDSVVCTLSLCTIPDHGKAISEMARVLRPGGRLLLLDHIGSHHWPVQAVLRFAERFSARNGEYLTRRPLPMLGPAGLTVTESQRLKLGTVERVAAVKNGVP